MVGRANDHRRFGILFQNEHGRQADSGSRVALARFADNLLPRDLRELLGTIREVRDRLAVDWERAAPVLRMARMNGGGRELGDYLGTLRTDVDQDRIVIGVRELQLSDEVSFARMMRLPLDPPTP